MTNKIINLGEVISTPVEGNVTEERLVEAFNNGDFDRLSSFESSGINHEQLIVAIEAGDTIEDFWGGVESTVAILETKVPTEFPKSSIEVGTEAEPKKEQMKWKDYARNYVVSLDGTTVLFMIGYTDSNKNLCHKVTNEELRLWISKFTIGKTTVWRDYKTLRASSKYSNNEES